MWGSQLYLVFFPLFLHLTHSSLGACWERGLSNIWHCGSEVANRLWCRNTHSHPRMERAKASSTSNTAFHTDTQSKIKSWMTQEEKNNNKKKHIAACRRSLMTLTGLCFAAGFLSAGFLAPFDTFLTVKGTPYLLAGLVIFCAGVSGMEPGAKRLASHVSKTYIQTFVQVCIQQ